MLSSADADTLTISGIKVVALDSDGTRLAAPATISVEVIDDQPSVEIAPAVADATPTTDTVAEDGANRLARSRLSRERTRMRRWR